MTEEILTDLNVSLKDVTALSGHERSRLLNFLLRWTYTGALHACLDRLIEDRPELVSLLDLRVRAWLAEERYEEALTLMQQRIQQKTSMTAQARLADIHLAMGHPESAERIADALMRDNEESVTVWRLKASIALSQDDTETALAAFQKLRALSPEGRGYLLGMMNLYRHNNDWVTASGYAVRLLNTVEAPYELPVDYLRQLMAYFEASEEATRVVEMQQAIEQRYQNELTELREYLDLGSQPPKPAPDQAPVTPEPETEKPAPAKPIDVTGAERDAIRQAVRELFGFETLLPGQLETMACVLRGENVLTILPTGGGKSLCYQATAMLNNDGVTLVISPLIALMKDQLDSLPEPLRRRATALNSSLDGDALQRELRRVARGDCRLVYAAPERLRQPTFLHALRSAGINRLVVDEAHCVSVWGHDFRPDYLKLHDAWQGLSKPPILALTATAPPRVRRDIIQQLSPDTPMRTVAGDVTRSNLQLEVCRASHNDEKLRRLLAFCKEVTNGGIAAAASTTSGIVYADTRARCERLAALLQSQGLSAVHYHAGVPNRDRVQDDFMSGRVQIIVATIAFGMGIDKPDIRFIVHFFPPKSLEAYYQEAGRAGRDGKPARCLLMVSSSDRGTLTRRMHRSMITVKFLRSIYVAVLRRVPGEFGRVALGDLERDVKADETQVRVALSVLEENGLLRRGPDVPRAALLGLADGAGGKQEPAFAAFCQTARLHDGHQVSRDLVEVARQAGLPPDQIEGQVLSWVDTGRLTSRFSGRDMLIHRQDPPDDVADRIQRWLERYETIQEQRIDEITAYAKTRHCRHGHLNAYLGGREIKRCKACDNCLTITPSKHAGLPTEGEQLATILQTMTSAPWSWGRMSLSRILRGDQRAPDKARAYPGFGALAFRSQSAIDHMLDALAAHDCVKERQLDNGGVVLDLTPTGRRLAHQPETLDKIISRAKQPTSRGKGNESNKEPFDGSLFDRLNQWRVKEATKRGTEPFAIIPTRTLRDIAARKPATKEALIDIKGIGPKRLERYGSILLALVKKHRSG